MGMVKEWGKVRKSGEKHDVFRFLSPIFYQIFLMAASIKL
jgi:hypothetical protein